MRKKIISMLLAAVMCTAVLSGCGNDSAEDTGKQDKAPEADHINMAVAFWYEMDAHKGYNGWYTSMYGITETLFRVNDSGEIEGLIAKDAVCNENTWTITLKDNVVFSNGNGVNADVVIKNLERAAEENERASNLASAEIAKVDDFSFTITTPDIYPALLDDLSDPYTSIMDIDNITDYNTGVIGTGPFVLDSYSAEDMITLNANKEYWGGETNLESASVYYIPDSSTEAMSLQSGEIDLYINPDVDSAELFSSDDAFAVASAPKTMARYIVFNQNRLPDVNVRKGIAQSVDKELICSALSGTDSVADCAYPEDSPYGDVEGLAYDPAAAEESMKAAGYEKNAEGMYAKDGQLLSVKVAYYMQRSTDKIATLLQDQLKMAGITAELVVYEDPDSTYMTTGDFDIALYQYSTSSGADSYAFLNATLSSGGNKNGGGFSNETVDALLNEMSTTADTERRAEIANEVQQIAVDEAAVCYYAIPNKITCMKAGVSDVGENSSKDYYMLNKDSKIK